MAQIHISKDPPHKTPVAFAYTSLTRYIVLGRFGLNGNHIGWREIGIVAPEFNNLKYYVNAQKGGNIIA
jgi:hypothetical protein